MDRDKHLSSPVEYIFNFYKQENFEKKNVLNVFMELFKV